MIYKLSYMATLKWVCFVNFSIIPFVYQYGCGNTKLKYYCGNNLYFVTKAKIESFIFCILILHGRRLFHQHRGLPVTYLELSMC